MKKPYRYKLYHENVGEYELLYEPDFSGAFSEIISRDLTYHGIQRSISLNVRFIKDGYNFIKDVYETFGIEANMTLTILELNKQINDYFTNSEWSISLVGYQIYDEFLTVNLEEIGIAQKFKTRDDVLIDLQKLTTLSDLTLQPFVNETHDISLHSKTIAKKFEGYSNKEQSDNFTEQAQVEIVPAVLDLHQPVTQIRYVLFSFQPEVNEIEGLTTTGMIITEDEPAPIFVVEEPGSHKINIDFDYKLQVSGYPKPNGLVQGCSLYSLGGGSFNDVQIDVFLKIENPDDATRDEIITIKHYEGVGCGLRIFTAEEAFNYYLEKEFIPNDRVSIYGKIRTYSNWFRPGPGVRYRFHSEFYTEQKVFNSLKIYALTQSPVPTSTAKSLLVFEAFARVAQSITDNADAFRSTLYGRTDSEPFSYDDDGDASLRSIVNGFQIRQFPLEEKPIFASFKDLFTTFEAIDNIGVGIEDNKIVVEKKSYFYNNTIVITLDSVADIKKSIAREYYYNEFENGFAKWENEEVNGLDEFNSKRKWTLPITVIKNKLSKLATYIGSGYAIEFTRRKTYVANSTVDWKYDNDNFVIVVRRNGIAFEADRDQDFDSDEFVNILDPATAYNLKISPKRTLKNWGYVLRAGIERYLSKSIKFAFGEANYLMESKLTTEPETVIENEDILGSELDAPLWLPEYYEFDAVLTTLQIQAIKANPYGVIKFSKTGVDHMSGYLLNCKITVDPENRYNKKGSFKLLRANI